MMAAKLGGDTALVIRRMQGGGHSRRKRGWCVVTRQPFSAGILQVSARSLSSSGKGQSCVVRREVARVEIGFEKGGNETVRRPLR